MTNWDLDGVISHRITVGKAYFLRTVTPAPQIISRLEAFLFLDMATLTILYSILFFFLRAQTRGLLKPSSPTDQHTIGDDFPLPTNTNQWEVTLGAPDDDPEDSPARTSGPVVITRSVAIYTEASSNQRPTLPNGNAQRTYHRITRVSVTLLIYPVLYVILTLPISMARIAEFAGHEWGLAFLHFGAGLFECTGWINVLLYTSTRKGLVSWDHLMFWRKKANLAGTSTVRTTKWNHSTPAPENEMDEFNSVKSVRRATSKTSASSVAALKNEFSTRAGSKVTESVESDDDSHFG